MTIDTNLLRALGWSEELISTVAEGAARLSDPVEARPTLEVHAITGGHASTTLDTSDSLPVGATVLGAPRR